MFVNERAKATVIESDLMLKQGQVFIGDKDSKFAAPEGKRVTVKLADGVMFEGGTWKGVDFDLRGCKHFIFRRVWTEDCRVLTDGAEECVIEYLTSPNPTPKQVFEIIGSGEEASHRVTETQSFLTPMVGVLATAPQLRISQPQFRSTAGFVSRKERKGFFNWGRSPQTPMKAPCGEAADIKQGKSGRGKRMLYAKQNIFCGAVARAIRIGVSFTILSAHPHNPQYYSAMSSSMAES